MKYDKPLNFSTSAAWLDYDGDGRLDLFVCNYIAWSPKKDIDEPYTLKGGDRAFGPPTAFEGTNCFLYRNLGNGKFEDVSAKAGIQVAGAFGKPSGKSLGVIACDVDGDGWPDIVVANDTVRNFFFHNKGDGTFEEIGVKSNLAFAVGEARGAMGVDWGEYYSGHIDQGTYHPGMFALLIGNFADEPDTFLRLDVPKMLLFSDAAMAVGIAGPSRQLLKFGVFFFDYDLDGRQDLLTCNGHLEPDIHQVKPGQFYRQPVQLFWNAGNDKKIAFAQVGEEDAGPGLFKPLVGRGCAYADIDGDGYLDVVLTENGGPARLLHNDGPDPNKGGKRNNWIRLTLQGDGVRSNKSAIGARVDLEVDGKVQRRQVSSARGYLSQSESTLTFGLGQNEKVDKVTIHWPGKNAGKQVIDGKDLAINKTHTINQPVP
jgi:hypothetical protein